MRGCWSMLVARAYPPPELARDTAPRISDNLRVEMQIDQRTEGGVTYVSLTGPLETDSLPAFKQHMESLLESGADRCCANFRGVTFINSTALGYLVTVGKRLKEVGGELVFSQPSQFFSDTFRTLELHHLFELFPSDRDAAAYFAGDAI